MEGNTSPDDWAEGLYEVERILDRITRDDGSNVYHVKWVGYPISSDPENFVHEDDMEGSQRRRQGKSVERKQALSPSTSRVEDANVQSQRAGEERRISQATAGTTHEMSEDVRDGAYEKISYTLGIPGPAHEDVVADHFVKGSKTNFCPSNGEGDDTHYGFRYVSGKSDGFVRGYKAVKVSLVMKHPITGKVVGVVIFVRPDGSVIGQYIPLREIHNNAPKELYDYFCAAKGSDRKGIALSLVWRRSDGI
ncbi:hypothetical protein KIN20_007772 [Parelaphostrongylus tenuis]|uniref:Chromo domain-containing protein n=1 Tax=Parelaphostrongylus tenuis TaxID=148309 RepID=A0AAD5M3U4_PARTN|nr:hypothetical protein KIN20_007772 [Parelaphostrongylus tenuis]